MKKYKFEFTDQSYTLRLFALSFVGFLLIVFTSSFTAPIIGIFPVIIIAFAVGTLIFILNKKKIKQQGTVVITDTYAEFILPQQTKRIVYTDIARHEFKMFFAGRLFIKLKNGEKLLIMANPNFCNPAGLIEVCQVFKKMITH